MIKFEYTMRRDKMEKKTWVTPELTVLVRFKPEEAVLIGCKGPTVSDPTDNHSNCWVNCYMCEIAPQS